MVAYIVPGFRIDTFFNGTAICFGEFSDRQEGGDHMEGGIAGGRRPRRIAATGSQQDGGQQGHRAERCVQRSDQNKRIGPPESTSGDLRMVLIQEAMQAGFGQSAPGERRQAKLTP